jgi:lysozyme family protein
MTDNYIDGVIRRICNREGSYSNDPQDGGGPTKYGITQATLSAWRHSSATPEDVQNLTLDEATQIYKIVYVEKPGYLAIDDDAMSEQLIDAGVNHGPSQAIKFLQAAVGAPHDGVMGPVTVAAFHAVKPSWKVFTQFMANRLNFYSLIISHKPSQSKFAAGWMNRCAEMTDLYIAATPIVEADESEILQVSKLARSQSLGIQASSAVRAKSADAFQILADKMANIQ